MNEDKAGDFFRSGIDDRILICLTSNSYLYLSLDYITVNTKAGCRGRGNGWRYDW